MMKQKINFYQERFQKSNGPLSFKFAVMIVAGVLSTLTLVAVVQSWRVDTLLDENQRLMEIHQNTALKLEEYTRKYPKISLDMGLQNIIEDRRLERKAKRQLVSFLSQGHGKNSRGFHDHLQALAAQKVEGLWLKSIKLSHQGKHITLEGSMFEPELLPKYIANLGNETVFSGSSFANMKLQRPEETEENPATHLDFILQSEVEK